MMKKRIGYTLIATIWILPVVLFVLFPYDIHGITESNWVGYIIRDFYIYPGFAFGYWLSGLVKDPITGASIILVIVGICIWLAILSSLVYWVLCRKSTVKTINSK